MKITEYYHKNSEVVAFERVEFDDGYWHESTYDESSNQLTYKDSDGDWCETTYDDIGDELTYKDSDGLFKIKDKVVTKKKFNKFIDKRSCVGKKVVIDGVEYTLK